jgi:hypothetical protein
LVFDAAVPTASRVGDMTMIANRDNRMPRAAYPAGRHADETPYDMVVVCLWFVFGVALTALLFWLALGGEF